VTTEAVFGRSANAVPKIPRNFSNVLEMLLRLLVRPSRPAQVLSTNVQVLEIDLPEMK
jgi:hypothetical protein